MQANIFLITPPFTQLNTPYPATAYLKGFLNTKNIPSRQADFGIEVILELFSKKGLQDIFETVRHKFENNISNENELSQNVQRIYALRTEYLKTIDPVILFLQDKNPTLALQICTENFLPEASRFSQLEDTEWAFGSM